MEIVGTNVGHLLVDSRIVVVQFDVLVDVVLKVLQRDKIRRAKFPQLEVQVDAFARVLKREKLRRIHSGISEGNPVGVSNIFHAGSCVGCQKLAEKRQNAVGIDLHSTGGFQTASVEHVSL